MSAGSATHNASKTALTRAAASSPPPSGTHICATLLNATLQRPTVAGRPSPLTPETLKAFPDRMRAADGRNAGGQSGVRRDQRDGWNAGSSLPLDGGGADGGGADDGGPAEALDPAGGATSRGALEVCCCWRGADVLTVASGWVASLSLDLSGVLS